MAHPQQIEFCTSVKDRFPNFFFNKRVLDAGSLDINGNNKYLFEECYYCGIDVGEGPNVNIVSKIHEFSALDETYDVIISTECFEHDMYYPDSLKNIVRMLKKGGLFLFTCATTGRAEHGTTATSPVDSPLLAEYGEWADYYKNLTEKDIRECLDIESVFDCFEFQTNEESHDLYFWGIKK